MAECLVFICRHCDHWHRATQYGKVESDSNIVCSARCGGPEVGGNFAAYSGPLKSVLSKFCYICGRENPEFALEPVLTTRPRLVGCCKMCFEREVKKMGVSFYAAKDPLRKVVGQ